MGLFDRFRPQPRWKHADPAVRAAAVDEIPVEEQALLQSIASDDAAPAVRLAAVRKLVDLNVLAALSREDVSPEVRDAAAQMLVDTAVGAFEGTSEADCLAALAAITDTKHVGAVAMSAALAAVRRQALARLDDARMLGLVARRAEDGATRLEALGRLTEEGEIAAVALRSEFKDASMGAVDRLAGRGVLAQVADKARNKSAAKRARARLRELDEALARQAAAAEAERRAADAVRAAARVREAESRRRAETICLDLERVAAGDNWADATSRLAAAEAAWKGGGREAAPDLSARFEAAAGAVREGLRQRAIELAALEERERAVRHARAGREAVAVRAEAAAGGTGTDTSDQLQAAWAALPPMPEGAAGRDGAEARRFEHAMARLAAQSRARAALEQRAARAEELAREFEALCEAPPRTWPKGQAGTLRRAWSELTSAGPVDGALAARVAVADERLHLIAAAEREARAQEQRDRLVQFEGLCEEAAALTAAPELVLKDGERVLKLLRAAEEDASPLPTREDRVRIQARLKAAHAHLAPRVRELRELDEWQRWANAGVQEELCLRAEALKDSATADPADAARRLAELQARWKEVAAAPRDQAQALWARFCAAADEVRARCDVYFARQADERNANLASKEALCQAAEALADSSDWLRTADEIKRLQAEWKTIGPVPRGREKPVWDRFRTACDRFFTRRQEDLAARKEVWAANLARKEALCARAEALAESTEWDAAIAEIKRLQAEWKTIGPVRKKKSEAVWQRFRGACDRFFERYQQRTMIQAGVNLAEREAIASELEALLPGGETGAAQGGEAGGEPGGDAAAEAAEAAPPDLVDRVRSAWNRWRTVSARGGVVASQGEAVDSRAAAALAKLASRFPDSFAGTEFDIDRNRRHLEDLCERIERLVPAGSASPAAEPVSVAHLATLLREALATNTMAARGAADTGNQLRQVGEEVRRAQSAWKRVGPVPPEIGESLSQRFNRACSQALRDREGRRSPMGVHR